MKYYPQFHDWQTVSNMTGNRITEIPSGHEMIELISRYRTMGYEVMFPIPTGLIIKYIENEEKVS